MKEKKKSRKATSPDPEQPGPSNAVNPEDNSSDMENRPQSPGEDDQAVPFILYANSFRFCGWGHVFVKRKALMYMLPQGFISICNYFMLRICHFVFN